MTQFFQTPHKTNITPLPSSPQADHDKNEGVTAETAETPLFIRVSRMTEETFGKSDDGEYGRIWLNVSPFVSPALRGGETLGELYNLLYIIYD